MIQFYCPNCSAIISFDSQHSGRQAKCATCDQGFIVPAESFVKPKAVTGEPEDRGDLVPGFYRAVLIDSWRVFLSPRNLVSMVFICAAVCFKFFTAHVDYSFTMNEFRVLLPIGLLVRLTVWGCLFWYYLEIVSAVVLDQDELPDIDIDGFAEFLGNALKSVFTFFMALLIVMLPTVAFLSLGIGSSNSITAQILAFLGLFFFPMIILTVGVNQNMEMMWRIDTMIKPVIRAFWPYLFTVLLLLLVWFLQMKTRIWGDITPAGKLHIALHIAAQMGIQVLAIVAMRTMGLFYRHYACYFSW